MQQVLSLIFQIQREVQLTSEAVALERFQTPQALSPNYLRSSISPPNFKLKRYFLHFKTSCTN